MKKIMLLLISLLLMLTMLASAMAEDAVFPEEARAQVSELLQLWFGADVPADASWVCGDDSALGRWGVLLEMESGCRSAYVGFDESGAIDYLCYSSGNEPSAQAPELGAACVEALDAALLRLEAAGCLSIADMIGSTMPAQTLPIDGVPAQPDVYCVCSFGGNGDKLYSRCVLIVSFLESGDISQVSVLRMP